MNNLNKTQIKSIMDRLNKKMQDLQKDIIITSGIIFTSDKDFYYIFTIYQDNKIKDKITADNIDDFDKIYKNLTNKYKVNIIYDYTDLNYNQLKYLSEYYITPNRIEQIELNNVYIDTLLTF